MTTDTITAPQYRIYAACLAAYNSGRLHGVWIDLGGKDADAVQDEINDMLARSPCPNVMRRKCADCGHWQTDAAPYAETASDCPRCGADMPHAFQRSAEEWAVHDFEGLAGFINTEWPDLEDLCSAVEFLEDADDDEQRALRWLLDQNHGADLSDAIDNARNVCIFDGEASDYAAEHYEEYYSEQLAALPSILRHAIDWQAVAHELRIGGDIAESEDAQGRFIVTNASEF